MKRTILDIFDKSVDEDGYIIENKTGDRVLAPKRDEVKLENFVGFTPGSEIVLTNDLPSLMQYVDIKNLLGDVYLRQNQGVFRACCA